MGKVVVKKVGCIVFSMLFLVGCSKYASNGEQLYLQSKNGPGVVVPPPLTSSNISHFYDLPQQTQNAKVSIVPTSGSVVSE